MEPKIVTTFIPRARLTATLALAAVTLLTSGYSSCTGTTGPLFAPPTITPPEVLLRASLAARQDAIGLARVDGGETDDEYQASIEYGKTPPAEWLSVEVAGRNLTLRANPDGLDPVTYVATVTLEGKKSGAGGALRVEFTVIP